MPKRLNEFETLVEAVDNDARQFYIDCEQTLPFEHNIIAAFQIAIAKAEEREKEYHIHPDGQMGASQIAICPYRKAWKWAGLPEPVKPSLKEDYGGRVVGRFWHERIIQPILQQHYAGRQIEGEFGCEIYVEFELVPGLRVQSPVDCIFATAAPGKPSPFLRKKLRFRNISEELPVLAPDAEVIAIFDLKSAAAFSTFEEYKKGLSYSYKGQGHAYMAGTGAKQIYFAFVNKNNMKMYYVKLFWDETFWEFVKSINQRALILSKLMRMTKKTIGALFRREDFAYIYNPDSVYECMWSCPLSRTHEERNERGDLELKFDKPCEAACQFVRAEALQFFNESGFERFKFGPSKVKIISVDEINDLVIAQNTSGTIYDVSIYEALKRFKPIVEETGKK